jgi:hypothetical protein
MDVILPPRTRNCTGCGSALTLVATRYGPVAKCPASARCVAPVLLRPYEILKMHRQRCRGAVDSTDDELLVGDLPVLTDAAQRSANAVDQTANAAAASRYGVEPRHRLVVEVRKLDREGAALFLRCDDAALIADVRSHFAISAVGLPLTSAAAQDVVGPYPIPLYDSVVSAAREFLQAHNSRATVAPLDPQEPSSEFFCALSLPPAPTLAFYGVGGHDDHPPCSTPAKVHDASASGAVAHLPLRSQQQASVHYALACGGRALIADEMGTGKTLSALATVAALQAFPLLIVVPASSRVHWADEVERWLRLDPSAVHVVWDSNSKPPDPFTVDVISAKRSRSRSRSRSGRRGTPSPSATPNGENRTAPPAPDDDDEEDAAAATEDAVALPTNAQVVITSYTMTVRLRESLCRRAWKGMIADESHILRSPSLIATQPLPAAATPGTNADGNATAQPTPALVTQSSQRLATLRALAAATPHVLLLSGTPSLVRAADLWDQVDMIRPGLLGPTLFDFAARYCVLEFTPHLRCGPCHRAREVGDLLRHACMTRTRKQEALPHLPAKERVILRVVMTTPSTGTPLLSPSSDPVDAPPTEATGASPEAARHSVDTAVFQRLYHESGDAKKAAVADFVLDKLSSVATAAGRTDVDEELEEDTAEPTQPLKIVIFAHHISVLDYFAGRLTTARVPFARIDGAVTGVLRQRRVSEFNADPSIRVAVLGVTACGVGIALASASVCVFAEVPPDAGWLLQAEDRLHRLGQRHRVVSYVCLGLGSAFDAKHFARLRSNLEAIHDLVDASSSVGKLPSAVHTSTRGTMGAAPSITEETATRLTTLRQCSRFTVSRHSGRLHGYSKAGRYSVSSVHRDELIDSEGCTAASDFADLYANLPPLARRAAMERGPLTVAELRQLASKSAGVATGSNRRFTPRWPTGGDGHSVPEGCLCFAWRTTVLRAPPPARKIPSVPKKPSADTAAVPTNTPPPPRRTPSPAWRSPSPQRILTVDDDVAGAETVSGLKVKSYSMGLLRLRPSEPIVGEDSTYSSHPRDWLVLCSQCLQPLPFVPASIGEAVAPGAVVELASDAHMFCSGTCRGLYWLARSGKSLRAQLEAADGGICAGCGVDCGELLDALTSVSPAKREQLLNERHPALAADPALARPLLERPVRGNCWHGDHVVPVSQGGGEASLRNLQTLCVVCHKAKTRLEARAYGWGSRPRKPVPP